MSPSWSQGGCHSSRPTSTHNIQKWKGGCLFLVSIGAKNPFPVAPRRLLTPHWLELVTCPCLNQKPAKGMEPHVCISGSGFTHPGWGRGEELGCLSGSVHTARWLCEKCLLDHKMHFKYFGYSLCFSYTLKSRKNIIGTILVPTYWTTYCE